MYTIKPVVWLPKEIKHSFKWISHFGVQSYLQFKLPSQQSSFYGIRQNLNFKINLFCRNLDKNSWCYLVTIDIFSLPEYMIFYHVYMFEGWCEYLSYDKWGWVQIYPKLGCQSPRFSLYLWQKWICHNANKIFFLFRENETTTQTSVESSFAFPILQHHHDLDTIVTN